MVRVVGAHEGGVDHRGSRRLGPLEQWTWYLIAAASYIGLGIFHKFLLNWFVGPIWFVTFVVVGPWLYDRMRGLRRAVR
jgi:hypothetical protein